MSPLVSNNNEFLVDIKNFLLIDLEKDLIIEDCLKADLNIGGTYFVLKNNSLKGLFKIGISEIQIKNLIQKLKTPSIYGKRI